MWRDFCCFTWNPACQDSRRNANVHFQASSHVSCLQEHLFTEVALWKVVTQYCWWCSSDFWWTFQEICLPSSEESVHNPCKIVTLERSCPTNNWFSLSIQMIFSRICIQQSWEIQCCMVSCCVFSESCVTVHSKSQSTKCNFIFSNFQVSFQPPKIKKDSTSKDALGECHLD